MPAVFVTCPVLGLNEQYAMANSWVISQILDLGVTGIQLCHAQSPRAVEVMAHYGRRYPFPFPGVAEDAAARPARRQRRYANQIWGMSNPEYVRVADLWPLNPKGEIIFGIKIENTTANANAAATLSVPGIAFAEWGPTDNNYWVNGLDGLPLDGSFDRDKSPPLIAIRRMILNLCKQRNIIFLNATSADPASPNYIIDQLKDGTMFGRPARKWRSWRGNSPSAGCRSGRRDHADARAAALVLLGLVSLRAGFQPATGAQ